MAEIVGVRFKKVGKVYHFDPCGLKTTVGQNVIVETSRGVEYGEVALANREVAEGEVVKPLKKIIRIATQSDAKVVETNKKRADDAFHICEQKIADHHLDMKLVSVEYTFDLSKVLFYFTADGRVDFRDLVKDLASVFRTRIELRQIGVRDEAKVLGGLGICGRPLCCSSFLDDFQPVSINMAKEQNLSLNPTKISGTCGRLMCCLKYEHEVYAELGKITPRPDSVVETPMGVGTVIDSSILRGTCAVRLDDDEDEIHTFRCEECQIVRASRKGRRNPNVATRAAAAAALSGSPKKADTEEMILFDNASEPEQDVLPQPSQPSQAEKPKRDGKQQRHRGKHRGEQRDNADKQPTEQRQEKRQRNNNNPNERKPRKPRQEGENPQAKEKPERKDTAPKQDGDKQKRRRRPRHRNGNGKNGGGQKPEGKSE